MLLVADAARVVMQDEYLERRKSLGAELLDLRLLKYSRGEAALEQGRAGGEAPPFLARRLAVHPGGMDRPVIAHHDGGENRLPDILGPAGGLFDGGG